MRPESNYELRQSAVWLEHMFLLASALGALAGVVVLLNRGLAVGVIALLPSAIAFGMSRLFGMASELFASIQRIEDCIRPRQKANDEKSSSVS